MKGIIDQTMAGMGVTDVAWQPGVHAAFRQGHCSDVTIGNKSAGIAGEISNHVQEEFDLPGKVYMAELDADAILEASTLHRPYERLPRYPAALRDLAIVVADTDDCSAAKLASAITAAGGELLANVGLFDVFADAKRLGEGKRSIAFSLEFRAPDRTLTDDEVNGVMERIRTVVVEDLGAQIRES